MAASGRSVPRSIAPVLEALELEQPTLVTQRYLEKLIKDFGATICALSYSDLTYDTVQSLAARVNVSL